MTTQPPPGWAMPGGDQPPPPPAGYGPPPGAVPSYGYGGWQPPYGAPVVTPGVVPLRPLTVGELLDAAVKVIRRYPKPTLGMAALLGIVTTLIDLVVLMATDFSAIAARAVDRQQSGGTTSFSVGDNVDFTDPRVYVGLVAASVLSGMLTVVVGRAVLGKAISAAEAWSQVRRRLGGLLGLALLTLVLASVPPLAGILLAVLLVAIGGPVTLLLGLPLAIGGVAAGVYLYVRLALAPPALILEGAGIRTALTRSSTLVRGSWWRTFWILFLALLIGAVVTFVASVPIFVVGYGTFTHPTAQGLQNIAIATAVASGLIGILVNPFVAGVRALLYVDRRMRAEGLDLTLQQAAAQA